jgi:hypothetical protein
MRVGILDLVLVTFVVLKLCNVIDWSWGLVLMPMWVEIIWGLISGIIKGIKRCKYFGIRKGE